MIRIKHILCPITLSPDSSGALRYAIALAGTYQATLTVCHCVDSASLSNATRREEELRTFEELVLSARHRLAALKQTSSPPFDFTSRIIEGDPAIAIPRFAAEHGADLIVMRSRRRPFAAALLGSTAETICRTAPCPVLVTHPDDEHEWAGLDGGILQLRRILIAYDFSLDAEVALNGGLSLAQEYQAEVHLLHSLPAAPALAHAGITATDDFVKAAHGLQQAVTPETHLWCRVKQVVRSGPAYREILHYAEENDIDLICLGARGAGFAMLSLFGSNADRVLRQSQCPVFVARPLRPVAKEANQ